MTSSPTSPQQTALTVIQQAVADLADWAGVTLTRPEDSPAIEEAKKYLSWPQDCQPRPLQLLFDSVKLSQNQEKQHFWQPCKLDDCNPTIPYPIPQTPTQGKLDSLKQQIQQEISFLENSEEDWQNLSLLTLILEKFGSFISFSESDVALIDESRITAAVAAVIANLSEPYKLSLVVGDLSGIQNFIYTISSDGALKSLRARSFYLELVTEEVVQQLLAELNLPRTNVIYAGGGNLYILAPGTEDIQKKVRQIRIQFNAWLLEQFQGKVFLALDSSQPFPVADIATQRFAKHWTEATKKLATYKSRKFGDRLSDLQSLIQPKYAHTPCAVCHRDDKQNLQALNGDSSVQACSTCREMFKLGGKLFKVEAIVRSQGQPGSYEQALHTVKFELPATEERAPVNIYYYLFDRWKQIVPESDTALLVNDWNLEHYRFQKFRNSLPLLLGNYPQKENPKNPGTSNFMSASEMAEEARGIKRMGYLRMDVDRLGLIFAQGLRDKQTLPRLAGLSRQMSYFFKVYLNSLAAKREENIPNNIKQLPKPEKVELEEKSPDDEPSTKDLARILLFIYAGGDDLFISGAWDEVVDFAFDVYQCFRAYTGYNPDITISGGISIADAKFPLYQAAGESGDAEEAAKGNGRDSLGLFNEVFKWDEWLGIDNIEKVSSEIRAYLKEETKPSLLGILPFVERLEQEKISITYSRNFVRNLLITAQIQKQELKSFKEKKSEAAMGTRYYLHLPKIAYTLSRLPPEVLKDYEFRQSLKNPYNAPYFRAIATWIELLNR